MNSNSNANVSVLLKTLPCVTDSIALIDTIKQVKNVQNSANILSSKVQQTIGVSKMNLKDKHKFLNGFSTDFGIGYHIGSTPYSIYDYQSFQNYFEVICNSRFTILESLPVKISANYYSKQTNYGLGNIFKIELDKSKFDRLNSLKEVEKVEKLTQQLNAADTLKGQIISKQHFLTEKLNYLEQLQNQIDQKSLTNQINQTDYLSSFSQTEIPSVDTINVPEKDSFSIFDSLKSKQNNINGLGDIKQYDYSTVQDSIKLLTEEAELLNKNLEMITNYQDSLKKVLTLTKNSLNSTEQAGKLDNKVKNWGKIENVNLEIGFAHPTFSRFLVNGVTVKGVSGFVQLSDLFFAMAAGKIWKPEIIAQNYNINDSLINDSLMVSNYPINQEKSIYSIKGGFGAMLGTHIYIGYLRGYLKDKTYTPNVQYTNNVYEIDGQLKWKNHIGALNYGRSYTSGFSLFENNSLSVNKNKNFIEGNALSLMLKSSFAAIRSDITFNGSLTEPNFRSYGLTDFSSGKMRYEIRTTHKIRKSTKIGLFHRLEIQSYGKSENNNVHVQSYGGYLNLKFGRRVNFSNSLMYSNYEFRGSEQLHRNSEMYFSNTMINVIPAWLHGKTNFNIQYSGHKMQGMQDLTRHRFALQSNYIVGKQTSTGIIVNHSYDQITRSSQINSTWINVFINYTSKSNLNLQAGMDIPANKMDMNDLGWKLAASKAIWKKLKFTVNVFDPINLKMQNIEFYTTNNTNLSGSLNLSYTF